MRKLEDIVPPSKRRENDLQNRINIVNEPKPFRFPFTTVVIFVAVIIVSIGALFYFSIERVDVTPSVVSATVQSSFTASKSIGDLPFEIITAQKIATQSVQGSGTKTVNDSASGIVTIYNTQSSAQKLIARTRFSSPAGLIYRIHSSVTVPAGTATNPGSVKATVYADHEGPSYNIAATSFTIPGLAGTPQASKVYAKSSSAMIGGASGTVPVIDKATEQSAVSAMQTALAPDLEAAIKSQVPDGYVLLNGASTITYDELAPAPSGTTGMVDVKIQGEVTAIIFPEIALATAVASSIQGLDYHGEGLTLQSTDGITLSSAGSELNADSTSFSFKLNGTAPLVYAINSARIAGAIAGKTRSAAEVALTSFPEVNRAVIVLRPFWRKTFSEDPSAISVVVLK